MMASTQALTYAAQPHHEVPPDTLRATMASGKAWTFLSPFPRSRETWINESGEVAEIVCFIWPRWRSAMCHLAVPPSALQAVDLVESPALLLPQPGVQRDFAAAPMGSSLSCITI